MNEIKKQKLRAIREMAGATQQYMAELIGVSRCTYIKKENCLVAFSIGEALKIADFLEVDLKAVDWGRAVASTTRTKRKYIHKNGANCA